MRAKDFQDFLRHTNDFKIMFTETGEICQKTIPFQRGYPRQTCMYQTSDCNWVPNHLTAICVEPKPDAFDFLNLHIIEIGQHGFVHLISLSRHFRALNTCNQLCVGAWKYNRHRKRWSEQTERTDREKYRKCYVWLWCKVRLTIGFLENCCVQAVKTWSKSIESNL